jgi:hypothetical protein
MERIHRCSTVAPRRPAGLVCELWVKTHGYLQIFATIEETVAGRGECDPLTR